MEEIPDFHYLQAIEESNRQIGLYYDYRLNRYVKNKNISFVI